MRGQILGVDAKSGEGQISGEDGQRYAFTPEDWADQRGPAAGLTVDFAADNGRAARIFRIPAPTDGSGQDALRHIRQAGAPNRVVAALLAFFLGVLGVHKFYMGKTGAGLIMLVLGTVGWLVIVPGLAIALIAFIECVIYLLTDDDTFERRYGKGGKSWF